MTTANNNSDLQVVQEDSSKMFTLANMLMNDINAILAVYEPVKEHLTEADKIYLEKLNSCALILDEK